MRCVTDKDEEAGRGAVRLIGARHRNNAAHVFDVVRFVGNGAARSLRERGRHRTSRREVAALDHKVFDDAVKESCIESADRGEVEEITHGVRRGFRQHLDLNQTHLRFHPHALRSHLRRRSIVERFGRRSRRVCSRSGGARVNLLRRRRGVRGLRRSCLLRERRGGEHYSAK